MTTVTPINVSVITQAVVDQLKADTRLAAVTIERSEDRNLSPEDCPWIGVYRLGVQYPQRVLSGIGGAREQRIRLLMLVQHANATSGAACEDELEELVANVLSALLSDVTLGRTVSFLDAFDVDYSRYTRSTSGAFMQTAAIQFVALTNTQVGG